MVLLTGSTGFLGTEVLKRLVARGCSVRVIVRPKTLARRRRLSPKSPQVQVVAGDLTDANLLRDAVRGAQVVYHLALIYRPRLVFDHAAADANVYATTKLLEASLNAGVRRFVYSSSVLVYGWIQPPALWPIPEHAPAVARLPYSSCKIFTEDLVRRFSRENGTEYINLRLSPIYGPGVPRYERFFRMLLYQPVRSVLNSAWPSHGLEQFGCSHWIQVCDAADAVVAAGTKRRAANTTLNIAGPETATRGELVRLVAELSGKLPARVTPDSGHQPSIYDISRAKAMLGFHPEVQLRQGIKEILDTMTRKTP